MNLFDGLAYGVSVAIIVWSLSSHLRRLAELKKKIGAPVAKWSEYFNFWLPSSLPRWAAVAAYLAWCVVQIATNPGGRSGYMSLLLLGIFLSLAPRRFVYLGTSGIIRRMEFFPWSEIKETRVVERGRARYLVTDQGKLRVPRNVPLTMFGPGRRDGSARTAT